MHFVLLPRRRFWWTGDLDRGATQLSRIRQRGRPPLCLEMISSPAIGSETSELLLHPQKKSCFPGQHPAANGKQMCSKCREESLMKAFLPPPGFLRVADSAPGVPSVSSDQCPRRDHPIPEEVLPRPRKCLAAKRCSLRGEKILKSGGGGGDVPLGRLCSKSWENRRWLPGRRGKGEREGEREIVLPALLFYWPSPPGD